MKLVYQMSTNGIHSIDKYSIDKNRLDNIPSIEDKPQVDLKHKYGEYKRILLKDTEYNKLIEDFGQDKILNQIRLLDEYIESNNNKNKYTNFNLVIRKSIKDKWFENKPLANKKTTNRLQRENNTNYEEFYDNM